MKRLALLALCQSARESLAVFSLYHRELDMDGKTRCMHCGNVWTGELHGHRRLWESDPIEPPIHKEGCPVPVAGAIIKAIDAELGKKKGLRKVKSLTLNLLLLASLALAGCDNKHDQEYTPVYVAPTVSEPLPPEIAAIPQSFGITRRSVHIGINRYPGAALAGCINDAHDMSDICRAAGFDDQRVILDEAATKANIIAGIKWAVSVPAPAIVCISYSGHGAQFSGPGSENEPDRLDEILCPVDLAWTPDTMVTDDELYAIFSKVPEGVAVWFMSDSCHSGDLLRELPTPNHKTIKSYPNVPPDVRARVRKARKNLAGAKTASLGNIAAGEGCATKQTSIDTTDDAGRPCGGFTNEFKKAYASNPARLFKTQIAACGAALAPYDQTPQAEGGLINQPFLTPCGWKKVKAKAPAEIIPLEKPANLKTSYYEIPAWPPATIKIVG